MSDDAWTWIIRGAGFLHFVTVLLAHFTPIPPNWDENLARLPDVHRRFALAQNVFIGGVMIFIGGASVLFPAEIMARSASARLFCAGVALWWVARLLVLPYLRVWPQLQSRMLRLGFVLLHAECALFAVAYGWLALRT